MNILVTGGAGFIGINAVRAFLAQGWEVTVFDNFSRKGTDINLALLQKEHGDRVVVERGDIRTDTEALARLANEHDVVLHLAGQVAVTTSVVEPREDFEHNAFGTLNVLEAVRQSERKPIFLFSSTNKVYGGLDHLPVEEQEKRYIFANGVESVSETTPLDFHSPYGCSKGAADQYVRDYARIYGLKTVVFRQSCIYGPHQMGVEDQGWVAWFLIAALMGRPVQIYGNGKQVRDLLYVDDLVDCYVRAIDKIDVAAGQVYNVGGGPGNTLSLLEFLEVLEGLGTPLTYSFDAVRPGDQPIFISDNTKARDKLGWEPKTSVQDGVPLLHAWLKDHVDALSPLYGQVPQSV